MQTFEFQVKATTDTGVEVPVDVKMEYPDNHGVYALRAVYQAIRDGGAIFMQEMAARGDLSVLEIVEDDADDEDDD